VFPEQIHSREDRQMKSAFLGSLAAISFLISAPLDWAAAQPLREPTVDEQFRNQAPAELPALNPPQPAATDSKQPHTIIAKDSQPKTAPVVGPAYLGVTFNTDERDAVVKSVTPGSPAAQSGLQPSDVIESIQGMRVRTYQDVLDAVSRMRPGEMLNIEFSRRMNLRTQAALSSLPSASQQTVGYPPEAASEHESLPVPGRNARATSPSKTYKQPYAGQNRNVSPYGPQRNYYDNQNDNNQQQDGGRRFFGFGRRRG
jgi:membrane-associated protease RseP (regulator of RpoE activity)